MKIQSLPYGTPTLLELIHATETSFPTGIPVNTRGQLHFDPQFREHLLTLWPQGTLDPLVLPVRGRNQEAQESLKTACEQTGAQVAWVLASTHAPLPQQQNKRAGTTAQPSSQSNASGKSIATEPLTGITLMVRSFVLAHDFPDPLELGLSAEHQKCLRNDHLRNYASFEKLTAYLKQELLLDPLPGENLGTAVICASPDKGDARLKSFRILGEHLSLDVARDAGDRLMVTRVVHAKKPSRRDSRPLWLVRLTLDFKDGSLVGVFQGQAREVIEQLVANGASYLKLWYQYNQMERQSLTQRFIRFGWLPYSKQKQARTGDWSFTLNAEDKGMHTLDKLQARIAEAQEDGLTLQAVATLPPELMRRHHLSLAAQTSVTSLPGQEEPNEEEDFDEDRILTGETSFLGLYSAHRNRHQGLELELSPTEAEKITPPPEKGFLIASPVGDLVRLRRREAAEASIRNSQNPMPQLALLLEDQPVNHPAHSRLKAISRASLKKFRDKPTPAQKKALEVALNTPDLALIQGPPGTGKTQVISALEVLLAEHAGDEAHLFGTVLLSSFQHDAVENAVQRSEVLGLPAVKLGRRSGEVMTLDDARAWRLKQLAHLQESLGKNPESAGYVALRSKLRALGTAYRQAPDRPAAWRKTLEGLLGALRPFISAELEERGRSLLDGLLPISKLSLSTLEELELKAVRGLRSSPLAFKDDGPAQALKLLKRSQARLTPTQRALLERVSEWQAGQPLEFLPELEALQAELLDALTPQPLPPVGPLAHPDVEILLAEFGEALCDHELCHVSGVEAALQAYREELEQDPGAVTDTVRSYTMVLASTCQQAVGRPMLRAKGIDERKTTLAFETVLIDEAARANPLDLLIPMSLAKRRVVLVGDQRQLPHMLEPDLERELELRADEQVRQRLKQSLFERLYEQLQAREKQDGICRTVMLDTQFRMHPALGEFVSLHFYDGRLKSGRPEADFVHALKDFSPGRHPLSREYSIQVSPESCMAWLEVPLEAGFEQGGRSKSRPTEARAIVRCLKDLMDDCDRSPHGHQRELTFGVITFYAAQVEALHDALYAEEMLSRTGNHEELRRPYQRLEDGRERLRVGTVDAFQGKEFDVVFLSMTRANQRSGGGEAAQRRRYGHLLLTNRLNVAMSRQQRLLVVAGAGEMLESPDAVSALLPLVNFHRLCHGQKALPVRENAGGEA